MNPIERALANADKITAANKGLEAMSRTGKRPATDANPDVGRTAGANQRQSGTMMSSVHRIKDGESRDFAANGRSVRVSYGSSQSLGDDNRPVRGATVGTYHVHSVDAQGNLGKLLAAEYHGPHANTPGAAKRGANPNARGYAAQHAYEAAMTHLSGGFADRRLAFDEKRAGSPRISDFHGGAGR
jgi:hypothetical protein